MTLAWIPDRLDMGGVLPLACLLYRNGKNEQESENTLFRPRYEVARHRKAGKKVRKGKVGESVKAFIQNVHHFRDEALLDAKPPPEHVVIFDEAQRAWNLRQTASFMQRKKKRPGFDQSEPEFLISYMDRHQDWSVIICLVGGGQEIHRGEAGIQAWLDAVNAKFPHWCMHIFSKLTDDTGTRQEERWRLYVTGRKSILTIASTWLFPCAPSGLRMCRHL
jgi:hypothetical protein